VDERTNGPEDRRLRDKLKVTSAVKKCRVGRGEGGGTRPDSKKRHAEKQTAKPCEFAQTYLYWRRREPGIPEGREHGPDCGAERHVERGGGQECR